MSARPAWQGRHVVVTRPQSQAQPLVEQIEARGGVAVRFPVLTIHAIEAPAALLSAAATIGQYDMAIFVSPNAARLALAAITAQQPWPAHVRAVAVGQGSARVIERFGVASVVTPQGPRFDSEALLERPELSAAAICGRRVAIFRGEQGRELLGRTLEARGALVERIACYRRERPHVDASGLRALLQQGRIDALTVTSSEGLRNLVEMVGSPARKELMQALLLVTHQRIGEAARQTGFEKIIVTAAGDDGLLAGLEAQFGMQ